MIVTFNAKYNIFSFLNVECLVNTGLCRCRSTPYTAKLMESETNIKSFELKVQGLSRDYMLLINDTLTIQL